MLRESREYFARSYEIAEQDRRPRWRDAIDGFVLVGRFE
jgi:hypothetical protein